MTLRAHALETALLRRHREARRHSDRLKYEDKRSRRHPGRGAGAMRAVLELWPVVPFLVLFHSSRIDAAYSVLALYATGTALVRASGLLNDLRYGQDLAVLGVLAAPDSLLFHRAWRRLAWTSLSALAAFAPLAALPFAAGRSGWSTVVAVVAVLLGWGVMLASIALAARWPHRHVFLAGGVIQLAVLGSVLVADRIPLVLPAAVSALIRLTPGGWVVESLRSCARGELPQALLWLVMPSFLVATLPWTRRQLQARHRVVEINVSPMGYATARFEGEPEGEAMAALADLDAHPAAMAGVANTESRAPATISDIPSLLGPMLEQTQAPVERIAYGVLSRRERAVAEVLLGAASLWSATWRIGVVAAAAGVAIGSLFPQLSTLPVMIALGGLIATPGLGGRWEGFDLIRNGAAYSPRHAPYPVGYGEVTRTILKVNAVRLLAALPAVLLLGVTVGRAFDLTLSDGFGLGARIFLVLLALQPATIAIKFARGTNDLEDAGTGLVVVILMLPMGCLFLAGVIGTLTASALVYVLAGFAVTAAAAFIVLVGYGLVYGRPWFDLVRRHRDDLPS